MNIVAAALAGALVKSSVEIPFRFLTPAAPLIMVPCKINGSGPYDFILDTGNGGMPLLLSPELAKNLKIKPATSEKGFVVDLNQSFHLAKIDKFELGGLKISPIDAAIAPAIADLQERMKVRIDGNIGYPVLKDYAFTLDFKRSTITLSKEEAKGKGIPFELDPAKPLIIIEAIANGKHLKLVLDTGASGCCLSHDAAKLLGLELGAEMSLNYAGKANSRVSAVKTLKVGDRSQENVRVIVADFVSELSKQVQMPIDGVLGYNFWSKYRLTIDYPHKQLLLDDPQ